MLWIGENINKDLERMTQPIIHFWTFYNSLIVVEQKKNIGL
jgi:hypothetical protein